MRVIAVLVLICCGAGPTLAKDISLPLGDEDQSNIRQLCFAAVKSPQMAFDATEKFVTFCAWVRAAMEREAAKPAAAAQAVDPPDSDLVKRQ